MDLLRWDGFGAERGWREETDEDGYANIVDGVALELDEIWRGARLRGYGETGDPRCATEAAAGQSAQSGLGGLAADARIHDAIGYTEKESLHEFI